MINTHANRFNRYGHNLNLQGIFGPIRNRPINNDMNVNFNNNYENDSNDKPFIKSINDGVNISLHAENLDVQDVLVPNVIKNNNGGYVPDTLHAVLRPVLILAQCLALLPVHGITAPTTESVRFKWISFRVLYTFLLFIGSGVIVFLSILRTTNIGISFLSTVDFVFFGSASINFLLFLKLAIEWPNMLQEWERSEKYIINSFGSLHELPKRIKLMAVIVMCLAIVEHVTSNITNIANALPCVDYQYNLNLIEAVHQMQFRQIFSVTKYSFWKAIPVSFLNLIVTFVWNFMDLFIMIMSVVLSARFGQINQRLESVKGKVIPSMFWRRTRESYNRLSCLTKLVDSKLSPVVLLSFANNLYFICLQLLNSLKPLQNLAQTVYFVYSFSYLVLRTCAVSLFAATIYDESKKPVSVLFSVPSESYCIEVQRFLTQVTTDDLSLTGYRFFSVTRTLMLTVAGTIVTYEIVLVQFNAVNTPEEIIMNLTALCP